MSISTRVVSLAVQALLGVALVSSAQAETYVVKPDGSGDFATIAAAISASTSGDIIELTNGTFLGDGNRDLAFAGKAITVRSQSGNPALCIIDVQGSPGTPHRAFSIVNGEGPGSVLEGITLTGGLIESPDSGAGLMVRGNSSPTIRNVHFVDNEAPSGAGAWSQGGAPSFIGCVFRNNRAESIGGDGGGIFLTDASASFTDCLFVGNIAGGAGGAMSCNFNSAPTFDNCTFSRNQAQAGAAIWARAQAKPTFTNCTFSENTAPSNRGILGARDTVEYTLINCLMVNSLGGFAINCTGSATVVMTCSNVFGNTDGDYVGCLDGLLGTDNNISLDPQFCSEAPDDDEYWWIQSDSPCAAANQATCGGIGAWAVLCELTPVQSTTWGAIKAGGAQR